MATESLGVVVLSYGSGGEHEALLDSLFREGLEPAQALLVHNPARPGESPPDVPAGCEVVQAASNLGYAGGMNLGLARLRGRGVRLALLLTQDARLRPSALEELLGAMERSPGFGILGPALLLSGTEEPFSFGGVTSASGATAHRKQLPGACPGGICACDWVDGGTLLLRLELTEVVGDFDERFWGYCEESDLCLRARGAGFAVGIVPAARADQEPGAAKRPGAWAYLMTRNGISYARRAAGARGLMAGLARAVGQVALGLARTLLRGSRLRPGDPAETWALAAGTARGMADYLRGRWGPPPPGLPGIGDVGNA